MPGINELIETPDRGGAELMLPTPPMTKAAKRRQRRIKAQGGQCLKSVDAGRDCVSPDLAVCAVVAMLNSAQQTLIALIDYPDDSVPEWMYEELERLNNVVIFANDVLESML
jgi:hypothetical protein